MSETTKTLQRWDCIMDGGEGARFADMDKDDNGGWVSYDDAEKLLAEVERLREENLKLRRTNEKLVSNIGGMLIRANNENERLRAENERLDNEDARTRHALKGWVFVCPDGGAEPTHERVAAVVAEVERLRAEVKRLREALRKIAAIDTYSRRTWIMAVKAARDALED
jgi:cell division protein FtsB